jgi:hypothetical protein
MPDKPSGKTRKGAGSSKKSAKNASNVTPIREAGSFRENQAEPTANAAPQSVRAEENSQENTELIIEQIRVRAYQLFEERGRQEGFEEEDWIRAEAEVLARFQRGKSA